MLIRSQDKRYSVNIDNVILETLDDEIICYHPADLATNNYITLGHYATEEKASKVSEIIHEAYADAKLNEILLPDVCKAANKSQQEKENTSIAKDIRNAFMKKMVFQMPEDSEVEV